jgi:60 kDa SS-A/Ro ribonucleoprotein
MANKTLFSSIKSKFTRTDTVNEAGGRAYKFTPKHALAQMAATGCFNGVYYASAQSQLDEPRGDLCCPRPPCDHASGS